MNKDCGNPACPGGQIPDTLARAMWTIVEYLAHEESKHFDDDMPLNHIYRDVVVLEMYCRRHEGQPINWEKTVRSYITQNSGSCEIVADSTIVECAILADVAEIIAYPDEIEAGDLPRLWTQKIQGLIDGFDPSDPESEIARELMECAGVANRVEQGSYDECNRSPARSNGEDFWGVGLDQVSVGV